MKNDNSTTRVTQLLREEARRLRPGDRLSSVRDLQISYRVSPLTVRRAVATLTAEGLIDARPGQGTFVRAVPDMTSHEVDLSWQSTALGPGRPTGSALVELVTPVPAGALPLSAGYLPEALQPLDALRRALIQAARRPSIWDRVPLDGLESLRSWFARELHPTISSHEVLICPGSQAAIGATLRALTTPGDALLVESPTYIGVLAAAEAAGLRVVPVPTDADGVRPHALSDAFHRTGARVFYCQPTFANPSGAVLAPERRRLVLEHVRDAGAFLVEDDWARNLAFVGDAPAPLAAHCPDGHVVYIRSLTKPAAPGLRIAAVIARGAARTRIRANRIIEDFFVSGLLQETALQLVTSPAWGRHLHHLRNNLLARRDALVDAIRTDFGPDAIAHVPQGGFHVWLRLPAGLDDCELAARAARQQIIVSPGSHWFPAEAPTPYLRLTFAAAEPPELRRGVKLLAQLLAQPRT